MASEGRKEDSPCEGETTTSDTTARDASHKGRDTVRRGETLTRVEISIGNQARNLFALLIFARNESPLCLLGDWIAAGQCEWFSCDQRARMKRNGFSVWKNSGTKCPV